MGSSDITSRLVAQTTEDTGLVPAGVTVARLAPGEALPGEEAGPLADPVQPAITIVQTAITAMTAARLRLASTRMPGPPRCLAELLSLLAPMPDATLPVFALSYGHLPQAIIP